MRFHNTTHLNRLSRAVEYCTTYIVHARLRTDSDVTACPSGRFHCNVWDAQLRALSGQQHDWTVVIGRLSPTHECRLGTPHLPAHLQYLPYCHHCPRTSTVVPFRVTARMTPSSLVSERLTHFNDLVSDTCGVFRLPPNSATYTVPTAACSAVTGSSTRSGICVDVKSPSSKFSWFICYYDFTWPTK
jgi:hypothetical protein